MVCLAKRTESNAKRPVQLTINLPNEAFKPEAANFWYGAAFALCCVAIITRATSN